MTCDLYRLWHTMTWFLGLLVVVVLLNVSCCYDVTSHYSQWELRFVMVSRYHSSMVILCCLGGEEWWQLTSKYLSCECVTSASTSASQIRLIIGSHKEYHYCTLLFSLAYPNILPSLSEWNVCPPFSKLTQIRDISLDNIYVIPIADSWR